MTTHTTDGELVRQARSGDLSAFTDLYERWFPRVYDYVMRMARNPDDAADVTQETFMRAMERLDQLREPEAFRGWLFAIARRQTLTRIEKRSRTSPVAALPDEAQGDYANPLLSMVETDTSLDPGVAREIQESASLVWEAAASLDERTYTVLDLHVRHGLTSAEIAEVMGTSKQTASMLVKRMRTRVGDAVGTYLLIRKGSRSCDDLSRIVQGFDIPPVNRTDRRAVNGHVKGCDVCSDTKKKLVAPHQMFAALAIVAAPAGLQATIRGRLVEAWSETGPPSSPEPPPDPVRLLLRPRVLVGLATATLVLGAGIFALARLGSSEPDETADGPSQTEAVATLTPTPTAEPESAATRLATPTTRATDPTTPDPTASAAVADAGGEDTEPVPPAPPPILASAMETIGPAFRSSELRSWRRR